MPPQVISIRTLSDVAGVTKSRILREIASGRLKAFRIGRRTVIRPEDLIEWLQGEARTTEAKSSLAEEISNSLKPKPTSSGGRLAYSVSEFSTLTSLSCDSVRREIKSVRLKVVVAGKGRVLITASSAEEWLGNLEPRKVG